MPTPGNPKRTFRMVTEPWWTAFEAACEEEGVPPGDKLRFLVEWYCRKPGVTIRRPPAAWKGRKAKGDHDPSSDTSR